MKLLYEVVLYNRKYLWEVLALNKVLKEHNAQIFVYLASELHDEEVTRILEAENISYSALGALSVVRDLFLNDNYTLEQFEKLTSDFEYKYNRTYTNEA